MFGYEYLISGFLCICYILKGFFVINVKYVDSLIGILKKGENR